MKKIQIRIGIVMALVLWLCAATALAADVFRFEEKSIQVFEGETFQPALVREGTPAEDGKITWSVGKDTVLQVTEDGTVTALKKGDSALKAVFQGEKKSWRATVNVKVLRAVTRVTLNTTKLQTYRPTDPAISGLLEEEPMGDVLLVPAGKSIRLAATCTPSDASSDRVSFTSSDEGVLRISGSTATAKQAGECVLTVASVQNPDVQEIWHVLVTQPVTKLTVTAPSGKTVAAGESLALGVEYSPYNATVKEVTWSSRNPAVATVDSEGNVTGVKKGITSITVKAADGSGVSGSITVNVGQRPTGIQVRAGEESLMIATRQQAYLHPSILPSNADERGVTFASTDSSIATVTPNGQVRGVKRGECAIVITSKGNPSVSMEVPVQVIQKVEKISFTGQPVSLPVRTTTQLTWNVLPEDATITDVTFTSSNRKVATVDQDGVVTGLTRGTSTITAAATDGSGKRGQVRVTVTQPVEGVQMQYEVYHVQLESYLNAKAIISPSNANNLNVHFTTDDSTVATVTDRRNIGHIRGWETGSTILTAETEDGGFTASAQIRVADYNRAVVPDDIYLEGENIRLVLRNRSDFPVDRVYFVIETWDGNGNPLVSNQDGQSSTFNGAYRLELLPGEITDHYRFDFDDFVQPTASIGAVKITITGWRDQEGYTRNIPEEQQPTQMFRRWNTPVPATPVPAPEA
ncbi:MAG: Ig-like domain-containing protein [Clostridia bacterium]|nr:Ig-like domain-containing protein [Clostridia bacterium]